MLFCTMWSMHIYISIYIESALWTFELRSNPQLVDDRRITGENYTIQQRQVLPEARQRLFEPICEPWCWYIYLHNWVIFKANVGKYTSTMEHMGNCVVVFFFIRYCSQFRCWCCGLIRFYTTCRVLHLQSVKRGGIIFIFKKKKVETISW